MMILCTSSEKNCGIWGKIAEDMDKFDLIRLQTNQMATVRSLKRTSQKQQSRTVSNEKDPCSSLIKGLTFKP